MSLTETLIVAGFSFWAPGGVPAVSCCGLWHKPTTADGKVGLVSEKTAFDLPIATLSEGESCQQCESQNSPWVGPSGRSTFSLALTDLKNGQTEVLASVAFYCLDLKGLNMMNFQQPIN